MLGRVVGNYRIVEKIGEGGMGAVYRAVDEMLDREVAVKAIRPELAREPQIVERFRAEAKILARLSHPAIATIYSFFHDGGELFLAMEYVYGRTLAEVISAHGAMPWQRAVPLLATALEGIEQAHRAGIIHRDLKPDNLMLTEAGTLKVMDFGIARMTGSSHMTQTGLLIGTLRYVAPEQIRGEEVDQRTDIYSLGAVLYQLLTARVPFDGPTDFAILRAQLDDPPVPPGTVVPGLPAWLDGAVLKALEKQPAARFQTAEELRLYLNRQGTGTSDVRSESTRELPTRVLPSRLEGDSAATMETDRPRLPQPLPPLPATAAAPAASSTSYRPVQGAAWKRGAIAAVLALALLGIGTFLWTRRGAEAPVPAEPAASPASTAATGGLEPRPAARTSTDDSTNADAASAATSAAVKPPSPAPAPRREVPKPAPAPISNPAPEEAAPQQTEPAAAEPSAAQEPPAASPDDLAPAGELPIEELRRLAAELVTASEKLGETYGAFLEQKEDGGAELTEKDEKLQEELEVLAEAAGRFNKRVKEGIFVRTRDRFRRADPQAEVVRRFGELATVGGRVDRLMSEVQPGPEVRQEWQEVRRRWERVTQILRRRPPLRP